MTHIAVLGAGAFGTALAISLAENGNKVTLIARDAAHVAEMDAARENTRRLPGHALPDGVTPSLDLPNADTVLVAIPTQALSGYLAPMASDLSGRTLVACNKGIDLQSGLGATGIMAAACPGASAAVLSGPGFANDIAAGLPTALTIASSDAALAETLQTQLSTRNIRLYRSSDVTGVEMGGSLKNVIAIAAGIAMGAGLGESARAALITRGYAELARFALARGALPETLSGLSGLGDLILTCTSEKSRNFSHGLNVARGQSTAPGKTVEGVSTAKVVSSLAKSADIAVPITDLVVQILAGKVTIEQARDALLARPLKQE